MNPSLPKLYFDLAAGLAGAQRAAEAIASLQQALREPEAADVSTEDIELALADSLNKAGRRGDAFQQYLELGLETPALFGKLQPVLQELLDPQVATTLLQTGGGEWIGKALVAFNDPKDRAALELLQIQLLILSGDYEKALSQFRTAVELSADACTASAGDIASSIETALEANVRAGSEGAAVQLKGEVLLLGDAKPDAAAAFLDAGRYFGGAEDYPRAVEVLRRSNSLDPLNQQVYWYLAEYIRLGAYQLPKDTQTEAFAESLGIWERGRALGALGPADAWAYAIRGLILDGQTAASAEPNRMYWDMAAYIEQSLLLDPSSPDAFAFLGRAYRGLRLLATATDVTDRAMSLDATNITALSERSSVLGDLDDDSVIPTLDAYRAAFGALNSWAEAVEGFALSVRGRHEDAIPFFERALEADPSDQAPRSLLGRAYRALGQEDRATAEFHKLYDWADPAEDSRIVYRAWAAYQLGDTRESRDLFLGLLEKSDDVFDTRAALSYCCLLDGDIETGKRWFHEALTGLSAPRTVADANLDLKTLLMQASARKDAPLITEAIQGFQGILQDALAAMSQRLYDALAASNEIRAAVMESEGEPAAPTWLASRLTLARMSAAASDWRTAVDLYRAVFESFGGDRCPEAADALVQALRSLSSERMAAGDVSGTKDAQRQLLVLHAVDQDEADMDVANAMHTAGLRDAAIAECQRIASSVARRPESRYLLGRVAMLLINLDRAEDAVSVSQLGRAAAEKSGDVDLESYFDAISGRGFARLGNVRMAHERFAASLRLRADHGQPDPAVAIQFAIDGVSGNTSDHEPTTVAEALALLDDEERARGRRSQPITTLRCESSLKGWASTAELAGTLAADGTALPTFKPPITLEVQAALFPEAADTPDARRLMDDELPSLQMRIRGTTGIRIPGTEVVTNERFPDGRYVIRLRGAYVTRGHVVGGAQFCADAEAVVAHGMRGTIVRESDGREQGAWLETDDAKTARDAGLVTLEPSAFMVRHLETVIRDRLASFVGIDELCSMVQDWRDEQPVQRQAIADAVLSDDLKRVSFRRVVKALIEEQVSIADLGATLSAFNASYDATLDDSNIVEAVRHQLKSALPGADGSVPLIVLSKDFESELKRHLRHSGDSLFLVLPREAEQAMLASVKAHFDKHRQQAAIVVKDSQLRPFVRRLVHAVLPGIAVLSRPELQSATIRPASEIALELGIAVGAVS